ncbi:MAG: sugar transferase [Propionibacteriaceae bacterium]|jgi:O-antigen biosynthesis protein WbqP|nr:sugar transferase [Propionibacteriaceae bacterium]
MNVGETVAPEQQRATAKTFGVLSHRWGYATQVKRALDCSVAMIGLVVSLVPMGIIAIVTKLTSRGPVFFRQSRVGRGGQEFVILKFRTMYVGSPVSRRLDNPAAHITPWGAVLRASSLDEIPQLFNILMGQMSFIGPRPVPSVEVITLDERRRNGAHLLRPGLSGWAQVNGRDTITELQRARYDGEYARRLCFLFDLKILVKTVVSVIGRLGYTEASIDSVDEPESAESASHGVADLVESAVSLSARAPEMFGAHDTIGDAGEAVESSSVEPDQWGRQRTLHTSSTGLSA